LYSPNQLHFFEEGEIDGLPSNILRVGMKGNPSFGDVRVAMIGVRNETNTELCGEVWFNELRLSELQNQGGWAAVAAMDANFADFANMSATGRISTIGFGSLEQGPNDRSREDVEEYDVVTNFNLGQMLPKKWGIQLPFNYGRSEKLITPQFDPEYQDVELQTRLDNEDNSERREQILGQSVDYTKRQSINFIGVRKERTGEGKQKAYDIENVTLSASYNQIDHNDFEIEDALDQNVRLGATYGYNFTPKTFEPFKKNDSIFTGKYWQFLKDINLNYLPTSIAVNSNILRQHNEQKFRELNLEDGNLGLPVLYQRNYLFDWDYAINYNLTKSFRFNFTTSNNRIVTNYINDGGFADNQIGIFDDFFDVGDPNQHSQSLQLNYDLPTAKFPFLKWIRATYSYTGDFQWQDGSDLFNNIDIELTDGSTQTYDLGNSVQNSSTHRINSTFDFSAFYRYIGLSKKKSNSSVSRRGKNGPSRGGGGFGDKGKGGKGGKEDSKVAASGFAAKGGKENAASGNGRGSSGASGLGSGDKAVNTIIGLATTIKKIQFNYQETNGIFLPGYKRSIGFAGTLKPTAGFTFGSQGEVRDQAARNGWLTLYPEFNEQYTENETVRLDVQINLEPIRDLKIDINGSRIYAENYSENYIIEEGIYNSLTPVTSGNFNISTLLIATAFQSTTDESSQPFDAFRSNRLIVANKLALDFYGTDAFPIDPETGYPVGFGATSQDVLLPAFLAAYKGSDVQSEKNGILRDLPLPNWDIKYTGLMRMGWFKKHFKRFSLQHGYSAGYSVNQFQTNLDYNRSRDGNPATASINQAGDFKSEQFLTNVNLTEQFSPLLKIDLEMKNSVKISAEFRKDRALGLSFANNLLTEIKGDEIVLGLGYRIKDLRIGTNFGGKKQILKSDLNFKLDLSRRDNRTIIRYLDIENNQTTAGQTIYGIQLLVDYALSKSLTAAFYYDHTFSEYAISTAFPQTTIRSGLTLRYNFGN
jgi:cell surface protein SprA